MPPGRHGRAVRAVLLLPAVDHAVLDRLRQPPELAYRGGQGPILHLEADLPDTVAWARANQRRWAFTLSNAGAYYAAFRKDLAQLQDLDWGAIGATDWRDPQVREAKQAELLVRDFFPWALVRRIGVHSNTIRARVMSLLAGSAWVPVVEVRPEWYY